MRHATNIRLRHNSQYPVQMLLWHSFSLQIKWENTGLLKTRKPADKPFQPPEMPMGSVIRLVSWVVCNANSWIALVIPLLLHSAISPPVTMFCNRLSKGHNSTSLQKRIFGKASFIK